MAPISLFYSSMLPPPDFVFQCLLSCFAPCSSSPPLLTAHPFFLSPSLDPSSLRFSLSLSSSSPPISRSLPKSSPSSSPPSGIFSSATIWYGLGGGRVDSQVGMIPGEEWISTVDWWQRDGKEGDKVITLLPYATHRNPASSGSIWRSIPSSSFFPSVLCLSSMRPPCVLSSGLCPARVSAWSPVECYWLNRPCEFLLNRHVHLQIRESLCRVLASASLSPVVIVPYTPISRLLIRCRACNPLLSPGSSLARLTYPLTIISPPFSSVGPAFWSVLWGVSGMILSVPLIACMRIVCQNLEHPYAR